jgi:hypothetical protein
VYDPGKAISEDSLPSHKKEGEARMEKDKISAYKRVN